MRNQKALEQKDKSLQDNLSSINPLIKNMGALHWIVAALMTH